MSKPGILVVDDDASVRSYLTKLLGTDGYDVACAASAEEAARKMAAGGLQPVLALVDIMLPGSNGLDLLARLRQAHPSLPVIMLSGVGQTRTVVEAMRAGAADYLVKPFEEAELQLAIANVLEKKQLREEVKVLRRRLDQYAAHADILSSSPAIQKIKDVCQHVADTDVPLLILGESGVGKEIVARFVHQQSNRSDKPFVKVNCAALPHDLLESELFGYERGAFSGALTDKPGKFELADKGTILLDEIAEMSPALQAKLLHVLQDGEYSRLGAKRSVRVDTRVIAATNKNLREVMVRGVFREDLYFRLNVINVTVPALRDRPEDIPLLASYFVQRFGEKYRRGVMEIPARLMEAFQRYAWPGNVRQLENAVKRFVIMPDVEQALFELAEEALTVPQAVGSRVVPMPVKVTRHRTR